MEDLGSWDESFDPTPIAEKRGIIGSLCSNDWQIFVKADVQSVARGLRAIRNHSLWSQDIYGQTITLGSHPCCYVLQLKGHPWSIVQYIPLDRQVPWVEQSFRHSIRMALNREDALALSRVLETEAVFFEYSDTGVYLRYCYYNLGAIIESLDYIEPRDGTRCYYEFESQIYSPDFKIEPHDASLVANRFFLYKDIYVLEVRWPSLDGHRAGDQVRFSFTGISKEDVQRADYLEF